MIRKTLPKLYIFIIAVLSPWIAEADQLGQQRTVLVRDIASLFVDYYEHSYNEYWCLENVLGFLHYLQGQGIDISKFRVVLLQAKQHLQPISARKNQIEWKHHYILIFNSYVFDFDYKIARPIFHSRYFKKMFGMNIPYKFTDGPSFVENPLILRNQIQNNQSYSLESYADAS